MKIFTNKNLIQKLVIALVFVTLLNFCFAPKVRADFGGKMMSYIRDFATALADVAISVVQFGMTGQWTYAVDDAGAAETDSSKDYWKKDSKIEYPIIQLSPELIFADKVELLSVDFIGGSAGKQYTLETDSDAISTLRTIIASWYVTLRTIAIVGLLSVLIYIGIRIMISSTSQDRAKYKQRLVDWIIAFCLLFFMHYIMAATVNVIGQVNSVLGDNLVSKGIPLNAEYGNVKYNPAALTANTQLNASNVVSGVSDWFSSKGYTLTNNTPPKQNSIIVSPGAAIPTTTTTDYWDFETTDGKKVQLTYTEITSIGVQSLGYSIGANSGLSEAEVNDLRSVVSTLSSTSNTSGTSAGENISRVKAANGIEITVAEDSINTGSSILYYINYARLYLNVSTADKYVPISVGYLIIYIVLVVFTGMFAFRYMKRVIYIAFLTLMAPMVAMTYPLDKIKDRKSTSI